MRDVGTAAMRRGWLAVVPLVLALGACAADPEPAAEPEMASEPAMDSEPASMDPRVFFVSPEEGGTYSASTPVPFEFGIENYELSPVPDVVEEPRGGMGHHHLGLDTNCLPAGALIPRDDPTWIHFGDASATIDMMLEPGEHSFVLQLGDDEHRAPEDEGLCARVTIRVEEGI